MNSVMFLACEFCVNFLSEAEISLSFTPTRQFKRCVATKNRLVSAA